MTAVEVPKVTGADTKVALFEGWGVDLVCWLWPREPDSSLVAEALKHHLCHLYMQREIVVSASLSQAAHLGPNLP